MTEKSDIEPMTTIEEAVSSADVFMYMVNPFLYDIFSCHNVLIIFMLHSSFSPQRYEKFLDNHDFF